MKFNSNYGIKENIFNFKLKNKHIFEKIKEDKYEVKSLKKIDFKDIRWVNQVDNKFILIFNPKNKKLILLDQHAVHERIRYEYFIKLLINKKPNFSSVFIKESDIIKNSILSIFIFNEYISEKHIIDQINKYLINFNQLKIEFELSNNILHIKKTLTIFGILINKDYIINMIDDFRKGLKIPNNINKIIMSFSCKRSIKFNEKVDKNLLQLIVDDIKYLDNCLYCIHGRNSAILI